MRKNGKKRQGGGEFGDAPAPIRDTEKDYNINNILTTTCVFIFLVCLPCIDLCLFCIHRKFGFTEFSNGGRLLTKKFVLSFFISLTAEITTSGRKKNRERGDLTILRQHVEYNIRGLPWKTRLNDFQASTTFRVHIPNTQLPSEKHATQKNHSTNFG